MHYFQNGARYEGEWKNGKSHGKGILKSEISEFFGRWVDGKKEGIGI